MISNRNERTSGVDKRFPVEFFVLLIVLMIPFWIFGGRPLPIPVKLPVSAFAAFMPMIAAVILTYHQDRFTGVKMLFKKVMDYRKIEHKIWYLPILLLYPLISLLSYLVMRITLRPLPDVQIPWLMVPVFMIVFFLFGIGEELGWMGFAYNSIQNRWGALKAGIFLGLVWALIHLIPDLQNAQTASWILWQRVGTIALRILMVWIYNNNGRSVFAMILFHVSVNLGWALFPNFGSHYDPLITSLIVLPVTGIVLLLWDSQTLKRFRFARPAETIAGERQDQILP